MGLCGIKGVPHSKKVTDDCDLIIALGARFAPTFCLGNPSTFAKNSFCVSINNDKDELNLNLKKVDLKINEDLDKFMPLFYKYIEKETFPDFKNWQKICSIRKKKDIIPNLFNKKNPIDLYRFMYLLGNKATKNHTLITDAGSNYYIGGQRTLIMAVKKYHLVQMRQWACLSHYQLVLLLLKKIIKFYL